MGLDTWTADTLRRLGWGKRGGRTVGDGPGGSAGGSGKWGQQVLLMDTQRDEIFLGGRLQKN